MNSRTRLNMHAYKMKVGDSVTTELIENEEKVIRKITQIHPDETGSGYRACADAGEECPTCNRKAGSPIDRGVDAAWFLPVNLHEEKEYV